MAPKVYALVKNGTVNNLIVADTDFLDFTAGSGMYDEAVPIEDGAMVSMGWAWDGTTFIAPLEPEPIPEPAPEPAPEG